jgi:phenylalanyl-tRNA synthetase beta chain
MRVSYSWLKELLPDLDATAGEVAARLTSLGLAVDGVIAFGASEDVVLVTVCKIEPHPSRDKLRLVTVDVGQGREERIVCGAPNVPAPGGMVVLAPLGTHLPVIGLTIEARPIGGVPSAGMLCSEQELGLSESADGIVVFAPGSAAPGTRLVDFVPVARDTVFDLAITPNRPDALGHLGVARDLAASFGIPFAPPMALEPRRTTALALNKLVTVEVDDRERCPIYAAAVVDDVTIGPSPDWLRYRLQALGIRSISNVVDITNLLLLEFGQPMHAFDQELVRGGRIVVRRAKAGEPFTTIDGVERKLDPDDLVIADAEGPTALAGVMGGIASEIRSTTKRVLLECAYFTPRGVRRTSRRHGLSTEASYRYERGVDHGAIPAVLDRAKALLAELAGGAIVPGSIVVQGPPIPAPAVRLRSSRLDALLGTPVPFDEASGVLVRLGFAVTPAEAGVLDAVVPSWRPDVSREVDLIEEVARVRGLDQIPTVLPATKPEEPRPALRLERNLAREAVSLGLSEAITYSFVSEKDLALVHAESAFVALRNPQTEDRQVMRTSLLPGLFDSLRRARRRGEQAVQLFSIGARFLAPELEFSEHALALSKGDEDRGVLPEERPSFAAVLAGPRAGYLEPPKDVDVWDAKGLAVELVERLTGRTPEVTLCSPPERPLHLHPRGAAVITLGPIRLGSLGPLHPDVADALDLGGPAVVVEIDLVALARLGHPTTVFRPIPRLPAVTRDVALIVPESVLAGDVEREIRKAAGELCESVELFDVFTGGAVGEGRRSLAYRVVYRDPKATTDPDGARTLTDDEVERQHERVRQAALHLGELRS